MLAEQLTLYSACNATITVPADVKDNAVTVTSGEVTINNVTIKTKGSNKSALHVYNSDNVQLHAVTLDNRETSGGAGMIVNGSNVSVRGALNILLGENSWGGINVDTKIGPAGVTFEDGSKVTMKAAMNL